MTCFGKKGSNMAFEKLKDAYYHFNGRPDERIMGEANRIYKAGFLMLSVGFIVDLYYQTALAQVRSVVEGAPIEFGFDPFLCGWFLVTMILCSIAMSRKGFVATGRFAETEEFPVGYFALLSGAAGLATGILGTLVRALAEFQVAGPQSIMWLVDGFIGASLLVMVFVLCFGAFYVSFLGAKRARKKSEASWED